MIMREDQLDVIWTHCLSWFKGNAQASRLILMMFEVAHVWDDLIDNDNPDLSKEDINKAFRYLIYDIPMNPIYRMIPSLPDHWLNVYLRWRDATAMEAEEKPDIDKTYMLRAGLYDIPIIIAYHLYGDDHAKQIGPSVRKLYGETIESLRGEICQIQ